MVILKLLFSWLVEVGYLSSNPLVVLRDGLKGFRQESKPQAIQTSRRLAERHLPGHLWAAIDMHVSALPLNPASARLRWIITVFQAGLRITEACLATMGDVVRASDQDDKDEWWMLSRRTVGIDRWTPLTSEFMSELRIYRAYLGLAPSPSPGESVPLILPLRMRGEDSHIRRAGMHKIIKGLLEAVARNLDNSGQCADATVLRTASAHWLRPLRE